MILEIPVAAGEVIDKITILPLKAAHVTDERKRRNVTRELALLERIAADHLPPLTDHETALAEINAQLWDVEAALRACEDAQHFDAAFIPLARSVYRLNDRRAEIKRAINEAVGSDIVEEKVYRTGPTVDLPR